MGDFNDYPNNESLSILTSEKFFNLMTTENISGTTYITTKEIGIG